MLNLESSQLAILERLQHRGFHIVAFPMYANQVGIRRGSCAALLAPSATGALQIYGEPCYLLKSNLSVRVHREGKQWFLWKKEKLEATPARLAELKQFAAELAESLLPTS